MILLEYILSLLITLNGSIFYRFILLIAYFLFQHYLRGNDLNRAEEMARTISRIRHCNIVSNLQIILYYL